MHIDQKKRADIIGKFYSTFSRQWNGKDKGVIRKLERMTKFSNDELEALQLRFLELIQSSPGISEHQFLEFFSKYLENAHIGFLDGYDREYFRSVFRNHDQDNSGFLDFREFACSLSVLLRGNLRDRLVILADTLQDEQGYVDAIQFSSKTNQLFSMLHKIIDFDEELIELEATFTLRAKSFYLEQKRISSSEVHVLISDPFINEVTLRTIRDNADNFELVLRAL